MECVRHRSQVLKCILDAKDELCPTVKVKESLIDLTVREVDSLHMFSLSELAEALAEKKAIVVSQPGQRVVRIDGLLFFEPYACISPENLFSEENSNQVISETFLEEVSATSYTKVDQLKHVLSINCAKLRAALGRAPPFQRDQPEYQCKLVFQMWKESTQNPTYGSLRSALDKYSVFCGRNPLVSVCMCVCPFVFMCVYSLCAWCKLFSSVDVCMQVHSFPHEVFIRVPTYCGSLWYVYTDIGIIMCTCNHPRS